MFLRYLLSFRCFSLSFIVISLLLSHSPVFADAVFNKIVAVVNGEIITQYELQEAIAPELLRNGLSRNSPAHTARIEAMERSVLDSLITDKLFVQEAKRYEISVKDSEVENEVRMMAQRNGMTLEQAIERMGKDGMSYEAFTEKLRNNILRSRLLSFMVGRKVVVTKEDVQAYYEAHKKDFQSERKAVVKVLVFAPDADAAKVVTLVRKGDLSFEDAVALYSVGPARDTGGLMGELVWSELAETWRSALEPLQDGGVSDVFVMDGRNMLLKLEHNVPGDTLPLDQVAGRIEDKLREPMLEERFQEYSGTLRDKAVIKILL